MNEAYTSSRTDIAAAAIAGGASTVLDVGCSNGAIAAELRRLSESDPVIVGIEIDAVLAQEAVAFVDELRVGDAASELSSLRADGRTFDTIILADVLEHLVDPWSALVDASAMLSPGGVVVISLPNVAHWQTFYNLAVHKRWPRRARGVYDATHLRWFAEADVRSLVAGAGLDLLSMKRKPRLADRPGARINRLSGMAARVWPTGFTYQFLVTASKE